MNPTQELFSVGSFSLPRQVRFFFSAPVRHSSAAGGDASVPRARMGLLSLSRIFFPSLKVKYGYPPRTVVSVVRTCAESLSPHQVRSCSFFPGFFFRAMAFPLVGGTANSLKDSRFLHYDNNPSFSLKSVDITFLRTNHASPSEEAAFKTAIGPDERWPSLFPPDDSHTIWKKRPLFWVLEVLSPCRTKPRRPFSPVDQLFFLTVPVAPFFLFFQDKDHLGRYFVLTKPSAVGVVFTFSPWSALFLGTFVAFPHHEPTTFSPLRCTRDWRCTVTTPFFSIPLFSFEHTLEFNAFPAPRLANLRRQD